MPTTADTTYLNVSFTPAQQAILDSDTQKINDLTDKLNNVLLPLKSDKDSQFKQIMDQPSSQWKTDALNSLNPSRNKVIQDVKDAMDALDEKNPGSYISRYNNDLVQVQNQVKLQIQQQQSNLNASTVAANNTPAAILQKSQSALELAQAQLEQQTAKRTETLKYAAFTLLCIVVIVAAVYIIKKVF